MTTDLLTDLETFARAAQASLDAIRTLIEEARREAVEPVSKPPRVPELKTLA